ncbi:hypothetical protein DL764_003077 [Monosporascus ibericus]|uniref:Uncharacterized protein n=1 Tax=Monosporascus ibericus TaxID=155417 RepID=A0A4Q4TJ31_9PEZI|nr:hypothetical protein DL764_003077 [Monosporascus ibericus]
MGDFAQFRPVQINLIDQDTAERMIRRLDIEETLNNAGDEVGDIADDAKEIPGNATDKVQDVTDDVIKKANEIVDEVGDKISEVGEVIERFVVKVLETIKKELNEWIQEFANTLGNLDVAQRYSLHVTTFCEVPRSNFTENSTKESNYTEAPTSCTYLFSGDKEAEFNATQNDGRILGFPPGKITAEILNLFMIPKEVQVKVRDPIDDTADYVQKILHDAKKTLKTWVIRLTFSPVLIFYAAACGSSWTLLLMLLADIGYFWFKNQVLPQARWVYPVLPLLATFCLFMGTLIVMVIGAVAKVMNIAASVFKISIEASSGFQTISWTLLFMMIAITIGIRGIHRESSGPGQFSKAVKRLKF